MKWIKLGKQAPERNRVNPKAYIVKEVNKKGVKAVSYKMDYDLIALQNHIPDVEWLDESSPEIDADELWDEFSEHIDDDIDSLSLVAGKSVITKSSFQKMIQKIQSLAI